MRSSVQSRSTLASELLGLSLRLSLGLKTPPDWVRSGVRDEADNGREGLGVVSRSLQTGRDAGTSRCNVLDLSV